MKEKKIPKFRRGSSILVKLNPTYEKYSMAYFNFDDIKKVPGDFKLGDLNELLKTKIFLLEQETLQINMQ